MKTENTKCKMCSTQHKTYSDGPVLKRDMSGCCKTTIIKTEVKDKFICSKTDDISVYQTITAVFLVLTDLNNYQEHISFKDTSPPLLEAGNIYLNNSVLLI